MLTTAESLAINLNKPFRLSYIWDYSEMAQRDCHEDFATKEEAMKRKAELGFHCYNASVQDVTYNP